MINTQPKPSPPKRGAILRLTSRAALWIGMGWLLAHVVASAQVPKAFRPEVLKLKPGFNWHQEHSARIDYYFESGSLAERDISKIESNVEDAYTHVLHLLGSDRADFRLQSFIVDSRARMKQLCGMESNGLAVGSAFLFVYADSIRAFGPHEPCHLLSQQLWGTPHGIWLAEGLAVYSEDSWHGHPLHSICRQLRSQGKLVPISELLDDRKWMQHSEMLSYPEVGSFIKFLYEKYGMADVKAVWITGAKGIVKAFGRTPEQLEAEWLNTVEQAPIGEFVYTAD